MSNIVKSGSVKLDGQKFVVEARGFVEPEPVKPAQPERVEELSERERIIRSANIEAEKVIKTAHVNAERLLRDVRQQCESRKMSVEKDAYEEGYRSGFDKAVSEAESMKDQAAKTLSEAEKRREEVYSRMEPEMVGLIMGITEKLLNGSVKINRQVIINLIKQGLSETTVTGDVNIRVSPEDFEAVAAEKEYLCAGIDSGLKVEIVKDNALGLGDCVIETGFGNIDVSLDQKLEALKQDLMFTLNNGE